MSRKLPQRRGALSLKEESGVHGLRQLGEAEQEEQRGLRRLKSGPAPLGENPAGEILMSGEDPRVSSLRQVLVLHVDKR